MGDCTLYSRRRSAAELDGYFAKLTGGKVPNISKRIFNPQTKEWDRGYRFRILGVDKQDRYYSATLDGDDVDGLWQAFDLGEPEKLVSPNVKVRYPKFNATMLNFIPFTQGTIQEFVSLMGANMSTGQPFLSKQNLYGIVEKLYPSTLTDWDTNELQKEEE